MKMQNAEMEFVAFDAQDVIATSGFKNSFTFSGLFDGTHFNATMTYEYGDKKGTAKNNWNSDNGPMYDALRDHLGFTVNGNTKVYVTDDDAGIDFNHFTGTGSSGIWGDGATNDAALQEKYNGVYKWISGNFYKIQQ